MHRYIWLVPLLPLLGAAVNGLLGRRFNFSERLVGSIGVGSVALAFLISLAAVISYGSNVWPRPYVTSEDGAFAYTWIPGGAVELTEGLEARARVEGDRLMDAEVERRASEQGIGPGGAVLVMRPNVPVKRGQGAVLDVEWSYQLDALSSIFMLIITGVGLCIFVFATGYMHGDRGFYRFFAYLGLFMFSMLVLVMGSNFMMMFVGWEGVGLCSYLLIGYYFDRKEAGDASRKAFITNRIGDFGFALAVFAVIATFGTTQYTAVFEQARAFPVETVLGPVTWGIMSWVALGLFVGACGKSAQIPLYVWLPDAMAGPTPVSALIHAATMVTAGLYMVTRCNVIFQHSQAMMTVVAVVGALTALFAATIGITQNDIKKVLAYSTVSQLGFMFLACGVGAFVIGIFHVMTHAFFKALMFLGAGSVIHAMHHEQDMRRMGGLRKYMPKTYWTFFAGWLAICGIIPFSGFWSKDEILWNAASTEYISGGWLLWLIATVAATCTAFYMTRLMALTFWGKERFLEVRAGGQADEAHAQAYADGEAAAHTAESPSVGDRPHHGPEERVGAAHALESAVLGEPEGVDARGHDIHDRHDPGDPAGHGHHPHGSVLPHESPRSMWMPLAALAVLATVGGFVGISPAFAGGAHVGGKLNIVNWLDPIIWNPATGQFGKHTPAQVSALAAHDKQTAGHEATKQEGSHSAPLPTRTDDEHTAPNAGGAHAPAGGEHAEAPLPYGGETRFNLAHSVQHALGDSHTAAEWFFIVVSLLVAGFGIWLGFLFYVWRPHLPGVWARRLGPLYRASFNKYRVDELYGALFTRRTMDAARGVYATDSRVIDGAVNGAAWLTRQLSRFTGNADRLVVDGAVNGIAGFVKLLMSPLLRAAQTGLTANYGLAMLLGLVAAVGLFFGPEIWDGLKSAIGNMFAFAF